MINDKIESRLFQLRREWVKYPQKRSIIELQAKIIKWKPRDTTSESEHKDMKLAKDIIDTLL